MEHGDCAAVAMSVAIGGLRTLDAKIADASLRGGRGRAPTTLDVRRASVATWKNNANHKGKTSVGIRRFGALGTRQPSATDDFGRSGRTTSCPVNWLQGGTKSSMTGLSAPGVFHTGRLSFSRMATNGAAMRGGPSPKRNTISSGWRVQSTTVDARQWIADEFKGKVAEAAVLRCIADHPLRAPLSVSAIARYTKLSPRQVRRVIVVLEKRGLLEVIAHEGGEGRTPANSYLLTLPMSN